MHWVSVLSVTTTIRQNNCRPTWQNKSWRSNSHLSSSKNTTHKNKHSSHKTALNQHSDQHAANVNGNVNKDYSSIQALLANLQTKELMPGIVYKKGAGALRLNILDIDTSEAPVMVKPIVAPQGATPLNCQRPYFIQPCHCRYQR